MGSEWMDKLNYPARQGIIYRIRVKMSFEGNLRAIKKESRYFTSF